MPEEERTTARVLTRNTGMIAEITVRTPADPRGQRHVAYAGEARIDGVPGGAAPIEIGFLDTAGSVAGSGPSTAAWGLDTVSSSGGRRTRR